HASTHSSRSRRHDGHAAGSAIAENVYGAAHSPHDAHFSTSSLPSAAASKNGVDTASRAAPGLIASPSRATWAASARVRAEDQRGVVVEGAPVAAQEDEVVRGHLAIAAVAARLDDRLGQRRRAPEVVARELTATRVRRKRSSHRGLATRHERAGLALLAEAVV